jgi:hypothetical protein
VDTAALDGQGIRATRDSFTRCVISVAITTLPTVIRLIRTALLPT